ncbi:serine O-acetyltransferase [Peribacillus sp. NPDC101480]|uniref:serine O-acetyltransferase n=1 Tax=Peribacillus sp. NPDC101480 TaxID=3390620 RepID=UPI003D0228A1
MIKNNKDYLYFLEADKLSMVINKRKPSLIGDECWKFTRLLRKVEYLTNCKKGLFGKVRLTFHRLRLRNLRMNLSLSIPINVFDAGMAIFHYGTIIINESARIGRNCQIYNGTNIAQDVVIGDNVYIGPGVKILIGVQIADGVRIGANSVISKSILEPNITVVGAPAKKISNKGSDHPFGTELIQQK